jgi:NitT/TauT family transport system substrate-binding protein
LGKRQKNPDVITAKQDYDTLRIVSFQPQWLHQAQFAGFYVAHQKGFYRALGLDVRIEMGGPERPSPVMLEKGNVEITTMFLTSALREWDKGNRIVNLAQLSQKSALLWVAKKSSGIREIKDLNDKKIGIWYSDFREPSMIFVKKHNLNIREVPIAWTINLFLKDGVDAMNMMRYNEYDVLLNTGIGEDELTVFPLADNGVDIPEDGIYCTEEYYLQNQAVCDDFTKASLDGWQYALNHQEEALSIVLAYQKKAHLPANIPHQRWMLSTMKDLILSKPSQYGKLTREDFISSTQMMKQLGYITKIPTYQEFVRNAADTDN